MISDPNCTTRSSIATLLDPFWNHAILSPKFLAFWCIVSVASLLKRKSGTGNAFTSHLVCTTMSCDENSSEHDKETSSFEVGMNIFYFRYKSSILVAWINDGWPFFLLWLRLRLFIVFGEGIWRCILCNSAMDFFWVVKFSRVHDVQWMVRFFSFIPFNGMILRESSSLSSPFLFVTSVKDSILRTVRTLSSSCGAICFKIFPRWRDLHRLRKTFIHSLFCGAGRILTMFIHSDRVELFCYFVWN